MQKTSKMLSIALLSTIFTVGLYANNDQAKLNKKLINAAKSGNVERMKQALADGAQINATDDDGETALHNAAERGRVKAAEFLVQNGANINAQAKDGDTPLHEAIDEGKLAMVKFLLEQGAGLNITNKDGHTALQEALEEGRQKITDAVQDAYSNSWRAQLGF